MGTSVALGPKSGNLTDALLWHALGLPRTTIGQKDRPAASTGANHHRHPAPTCRPELLSTVYAPGLIVSYQKLLVPKNRMLVRHRFFELVSQACKP